MATDRRCSFEGRASRLDVALDDLANERVSDLADQAVL